METLFPCVRYVHVCVCTSIHIVAVHTIYYDTSVSIQPATDVVIGGASADGSFIYDGLVFVVYRCM